MKTITDIYTNYPEIPYISPERSAEDIARTKTVPRRNMLRTKEGYCQGTLFYCGG